MSYKYFSLDGIILPADQATISVNNIAYSYGYGVYENIRVANGKIYFLSDHCARLMNSAKIIALAHNFSPELISQSIQELLDKNQAATCNVKVLLIGGQSSDDASLYIMCLNPLFPGRKLYKTGTSATIYHYEREFPQAKTLNMLSSYLAYRDARAAGAYDALLVDRQGNINEGTRTNFFGLRGRTIITPPESKILPGVTRHYVLKVASENNFEITDEDIPLANLANYDTLFLTSTSSKIMPLRRIGKQELPPIPQHLQELIEHFDQFLDRSA